jgi:glucokinase
VFQRSEELLREPMDRVLKKECLSYARNVCTVVPAALMENIGDYAALSVATLSMENNL